MSKNIPLPNGLFAIVDDEDYERCSQFKWHLNAQGYAIHDSKKSDGARTITRLSRFIMAAPGHLDVDHIHGNLLDNRKSELRLCTRQQNCCNRGKSPTNTSGYKGVSWHKRARSWTAQIHLNQKKIHLGYFKDILDAAAAYADAAKKFHGEFART